MAFIVIAGAAQWAVDSEEFPTLWDGVWWSVVTVTTVGYGDLYPKTTEGRLIGIGVMASGIAFVALLTAAIAARFVREDDSGTEDLREALARIESDIRDIKQQLESPSSAR